MNCYKQEVYGTEVYLKTIIGSNSDYLLNEKFMLAYKANLVLGLFNDCFES